MRPHVINNPGMERPSSPARRGWVVGSRVEGGGGVSGGGGGGGEDVTTPYDGRADGMEPRECNTWEK